MTAAELIKDTRQYLDAISDDPWEWELWITNALKGLCDSLEKERKRSAFFIREAREYREAYRQLDRHWVHPRGF